MLRAETEDKPYFQDFDDESSGPGMMSGAVSSVGTPLASGKHIHLSQRLQISQLTRYRSLSTLTNQHDCNARHDFSLRFDLARKGEGDSSILGYQEREYLYCLNTILFSQTARALKAHAVQTSIDAKGRRLKDWRARLIACPTRALQ